MLRNMRVDNERIVWRDVVVWILSVTSQSPRTRNVTRIHLVVSLFTKLRCHRIFLTLQPSHVNAPKWNPAAGSSHTLHCWFICNYRNYRSYSKEIRQSQLLRLILGRIKCGVTGWWGGEPVFYVRFDFYSSHDILRMFQQDLEYEKSNWKYVGTLIKRVC